jgi:hypothetical protein
MILQDLLFQEAAMNPGAYAQSLASAPKKMLIGFEFEVCVPEKTLEQARPEKLPRTMAEVWKDFKGILNSFEDYVKTNDFDRMFKLRGGRRLTIPGSGTAYYKMSDAVKDYDSESEEDLVIKTILKHNSMWKASDFILAFDFFVDTVEKYINDYNELYGIDDDDDDYDDETYRYTESAAVLKTAVKQYLSGGRTPQVFRSYHEQSKNNRDWYIEPDGSLDPNNDDGAAEIVSPPLPVEKAMAALDGFYNMAAALDLYTNESTGLHINVSVPQEIDILKLAVFVGDQYVLKMFGRERSTYADSLYRAIQQGRDINAVAQIWANSNLGQESRIAELRRLANEFSSDHMASVSDNGKYISFRHAGGDYINDRTKIVNAVGRFARAIMIASDPQAYRAEYLKKLTQLLAPAADRQARRQQASAVTAANIRPAITDIRANGVPAIQVDLVGLWDAPGWNLVPFRVMQIRDSFPFHGVKTRGQNQAALDNIIQRYPGRFDPGRLSRPNPVAGRDYHASRFLLIPKTLEGARALLTIDIERYNDNDVSAAVDLVRIPLNNAKARDIRLDIQNTIAQLRGSASGQ